MPSQMNEAALESHIENAFLADGYEAGNPANFDSHFALDTEVFWRFMETTQPKELDKLSSQHNWQRMVLERLDRKIKSDGILSVLKKGLSIDNAHLTLLYRTPYNRLNPDVIKLFNSNIFTITRQVHYSVSEPLKSVDMVLSINGLPIATFELKNPWTGQNVNHAKKQYCNDRDPKETLFQFRRCLVHFAVDPDLVFMTTKVDGAKTFFLPFNKGDKFGKGNPPNMLGHKTAYLWEEVLTRSSLTNIIEHFSKVVVEKDPKTKKKTCKLFFPRYHQLDVVRKILAHVKEKGVGNSYLIQHSAGSGKTNSITWLAYQLVELYDQNGMNSIFDSVIVVTDRNVLDKQLRDNIKQFAEVKNIVAPAHNSRELKENLEQGKKLIITTVQKFPFIVEGIEDLSDKNFAVVIDEAHSSQSGRSADLMNTSLGERDEQEEVDWQDKILAAIKGRRMNTNASYFAFTATPKPATLEKFGTQDKDGKFVPFHLYSMRQAIEEGFILDVLANYTTYKSYYKIHKSIKDNPVFDNSKAQRKLKAFVESNPKTIEAKAKVMVDHFVSSVWQKKKLKGKAKAMVVTQSIKSAIRYFFAIRKELKEQNMPFGALVAFSGDKTIDGVKHTESSLNGFPGGEIAEKFKLDDYKILIVANKFQTGFDEPLLHSMYVDKRLQGVTAVQTLSRLNRCNDKMGKKDTFILDFYNTVDEIKKAFDPFYTATSLSEPTDINVLHDIKEQLDSTGVYEWDEVEEFNKLFFEEADADRLSPILDTVVERFEKDLDDDEKIDFKIKAKQFVKIYSQVASIIPFENVDWEMLHWFLKFLIPKLKVKNTEDDKIDELLNSIDLSTYGLQRSKLSVKIELNSEESELLPQNPTPRGLHDGGEQDPLDEIIKIFNEHNFDGWNATPEEQKIKIINIAKHVVDNPKYAEQIANNPDRQNSNIALRKLIKLAVNSERKRELDLYKNYANDKDFEQTINSMIAGILAHFSVNEIHELAVNR
ncbi:DEAD/DEAH box helicase family protein [Desulfobaculum bizertense]|uniref:type I restriction endonuclease subunit R n=1 Tax=Desulfobaculum bizertense TaxID=376490 RepID=UPI001F1BA44C|nr:DEAD/DEAH box helicase family protein [Desulfobaculum bizertense]UIJ38949.1 DEAD/DEAH box helicase family protein [Desulfobaculum bizertense]